jgi:hypothetical protein
MRLCSIRSANITTPFLRDAFERHGIAVMQQIFAVRGDFYLGTERVFIANHVQEVQDWLTEKADRADRLETWHLILEVTITILVAADLLMWIIRGR